MPELRKDPILERWVIISTERQKRPQDFFLQEPPKHTGGFCPFCEGNEDKTPHEIYSVRRNGTAPDRPGWSLRTVPNRFPVLAVEGEMGREAVGLFDKMNGIGAHEVIIESPEHNDTLSSLSITQFTDLLCAYRERIADLKRDSRLKYVLIFKNHGFAAGASLEHSHSQLIALPIIPKQVAEELDGCKKHFELKERCIYCDIIRQEKEQKERVISENDSFITLAPFAPLSPFETWILPKAHHCSYEHATDDLLGSLARLFSDTLKRLDKVLGCQPYNFILHTSPFGMEDLDYFHWHFEIMPKLTKTAGFEWGSGFHINPTSPEEAAAILREVSVV